MNKRIDGTFVDYQHMVMAINDMLAEGYAAEQLLVVTREEDGRKLKEDTTVQVVITSDQEESLWDKIVSFFTVEMDDDDDSEEVNEDVDEEEIFEDYGIDSDTYERFEEALDNGEYLLLVDDAPPARVEHSEFMVRDGIISEEESMMDKEDNKQPVEHEKKSAQPDWVNKNDSVTGDVENHSREAEKEMTPDSQNDNDEKPSQILVDEHVSHPELDESMDRVSKDPFGMETEAVEKGQGGKDTDPEYDETDHTPPAL